MLHFLTLGITLGLSAGITPGPLLALVVAETLRHGVAAGIRVACAPLLTDLPIIAVSLLLLTRLTAQPKILGLLSLAGGLLLLFFGWQDLRRRDTALPMPKESPQPLRKGIAVNLLSPYPYLFWLGVGAPLAARALAQGLDTAAAFLGGFYALLVGSKVMLAMATGKSSAFLSGRAYRFTLRLLGLVLCGLAVLLLWDGITLLRGASL